MLVTPEVYLYPNIHKLKNINDLLLWNVGDPRSTLWDKWYKTYVCGKRLTSL